MYGCMNSSSPILTLTGFSPKMSWTCIMDVGPSRPCSLMKMSKKILIAGVPPPSVGKNCGKSRVNGCGTCASHLDRQCRQARYVRWSGHHLQRLLPCSLPGKTRQKSMARGSALESQDERLVASQQMPLPCKRMGRSVAQPELASG